MLMASTRLHMHRHSSSKVCRLGFERATAGGSVLPQRDGIENVWCGAAISSSQRERLKNRGQKQLHTHMHTHIKRLTHLF